MTETTRLPAIAIGVIYLAACVFMLAKLSDGDSVFFHVLFGILISIPIAGGAWIGRLFKSEAVAILFYLAVIGAAVWGYYEIWRTMFVLPLDPQSAIALVIGPFYQAAIVGIATIVAIFVDRQVSKP